MSSDDEGFLGNEVGLDAMEMVNLLSIVYEYFVNIGSRQSVEAMKEAMMDGLGHIYFCRREWRRSSLLMSIEPDLKQAVRSKQTAHAVEQFITEAEEPLSEIIDAFVQHKMRYRL
jgi:hypothetical protein